MIDLQRLAKIQPELTANEFSVLFYISNCCSYAQSIGLEYYEASFRQIREHTNIKKNDTIIKTLNRLIELGLITKQTEWDAEKNRKTKCKFTSALVLEVSKATPINRLETENKTETQIEASPLNRLEIDGKASPLNGQINNLIKLSHINTTSNIGTYKEDERMEVEDECEIKRKYDNIKSDIDKGYIRTMKDLHFRVQFDCLPACEESKLKYYLQITKTFDGTPRVEEAQAIYYTVHRV